MKAEDIVEIEIDSGHNGMILQVEANSDGNERISMETGDKIFISIMSQYTPFGDLEGFPELQRSVSFKDYDRLSKIFLDRETAMMQQKWKKQSRLWG